MTVVFPEIPKGAPTELAQLSQVTGASATSMLWLCVRLASELMRLDTYLAHPDV